MVVLGLRKLLDDRCEYETRSELDPERVRHAVFHEAAAAYRALDIRHDLDREAVLARVAESLGTTAAALERDMFADLRDSEILCAFKRLDATELLERYNVALAQAVLLRATRVVVVIQRETPERYRSLFRTIRFHGLIHVVEARSDGGYTISLDGPFSLYDAGVRYGLRLAMFLPALLACDNWKLVAEVLWGAGRERRVFELEPEAGLTTHAFERTTTAPDTDAFCVAFRALASEWSVALNERVFSLPGEVVCVPDLVFRHRETGAEVYLEAFGFWSRDAVWRRIELVRKGLSVPLVLAVSKKLRVSAEVLEDGEAAELYVYVSTMSPRAVLERLRARCPAMVSPVAP
jgi:uncharacterized protein